MRSLDLGLVTQNILLTCTFFACTLAGVAGAVRITGGMLGSGQVEIFLSGRWGSICAGGHWDTNAAQVVCRELGFSDGTATATAMSDLPEETTVYQVRGSL